jgi:epoxyqueuosine reductase
MLNSEQVKQRARELGFDLCGIAPAEAFPELTFFREWLARGYSGTMAYLPRSAKRRADVRRALPTVRSVIMTGTIYNSDASSSAGGADPTRGDIARYARGDDYHDVLGRRLETLVAWMREQQLEPFDALAYVDTGPVQERVYAQYAGLGWIGKNTCVISPELGSWMLLAEIISSLPLEPDQPALDQCGTCTLCLDACPTGAFVGPHVLDATKCLSYLTIEYRGGMSDSQRESIGNHLFGCDICQEVCPWNAMAATANDKWPVRHELSLLKIADLSRRSDEELARMIEGTPLTRAGVKGLRRNLAVALENSGDERALAALQETELPDALVADL